MNYISLSVESAACCTVMVLSFDCPVNMGTNRFMYSSSIILCLIYVCFVTRAFTIINILSILQRGLFFQSSMLPLKWTRKNVAFLTFLLQKVYGISSQDNVPIIKN